MGTRVRDDAGTPQSRAHPESTVDQDALKRAAAAAALERVESGMVLGLGTGSTVYFLVEMLGEALTEGRLQDIVGVPTSVRTDTQARGLSIPLVSLGDRPRLDLTIDGADEVGPGLDLIKGLGGALLREKMVAQASNRLLIIADETKLVDRLGSKSRLPVEVIEWGREAQTSYLESLGADVVLRTTDGGDPIRSDNGNMFLDCAFDGGIENPRALATELAERAGVVDHGLFLGIATEALIARGDGIEAMEAGE